MRHDIWRALVCGVAILLAAAAPDRPQAARVDEVTDDYFGKLEIDPYRWMETPSAELDDWVRAQDGYARATLALIPAREALRKHLDELAGQLNVVTIVLRAGHRVFFKRQDSGEDQGKLIVRDQDSGTERVLLDPNKTTGGSHHLSIDQFRPSQDGRYVAVGMSLGGSEEDILRVVDAEAGQVLPDSIDRARFAEPSWLPDGRSFFYNRLHVSGPHEPPSERFTNNRVFIHHLGNDPAQDLPVFGTAVGELKTIAPTDFVQVVSLTGTRYALGIQSDGVSPEISLYLSKLPDKGDTGFSWQKIADKSDGIVGASASRDTLYLRSEQNAPRYKVLSIPLDAPDLKTAKQVLPAGDAVITNIAAAGDGLYVAGRRGAVSFLQRIGDDGKPLDIKLPRAGSIAEGDLVGDPRVPGVLVGVATWVAPASWFVTSGGDTPDVTDLGITPHEDAPKDYLITETTIAARDKTMVPLTIIEKKGTPHDHKQLVLMEGYGAYGISEEPFARFVPVVRGWVDAGGVLAIAHVRGGGYLGEDWHQAGRKATKLNTIHDFIDCANAMVKLGYAANGTIAGMGTSAGGIPIGGAVTQSAGLFRAALIRSGITDTLRFETTEGGPANTAEFGTVQDRTEFWSLLAMDAYQHVKPGLTYPAVMLTAGAHDHRVPLWQAAKMAARLQAVGNNKGPILLRVDYEGGHGTIGAGQKQADADWADGFAFLLWQLGAKDYQPAR